MQVSISTASTLSPATCSELLSTFIQSLLFMRRQIHITYDGLLEMARANKQTVSGAYNVPAGNGCPAAVCTSNTMPLDTVHGQQSTNVTASAMLGATARLSVRQCRKAQQFTKASEALLATLGPDLFGVQRPTRMLLAFGSAVARPKEIYELRFIAAAGRVPGTMPHRELQALKHRVIRMLVAEAASAEEGPASQGPTRMWTLVALPPGCDVPSGFLPKRGLKLNLRKCMYSTITIGVPRKQRPIAEAFSRLMHPQPSSSVISTVSTESGAECEVASCGMQQETWCLANIVLKGMAVG